jgi:hypothetical protein
VHITGAGTCTLKATQDGDANFTSASTQTSFTIAKAAQSITFPVIPDHAYGDPAFSVTATASSGLVVQLAKVSGPCSVTTKGVVTLTGVGICTLKASQAGNANFLAAPDVQRSFAIGKGNQTITFPAIPDHHLGDPDFTVTAAASSGLPVRFSHDSGQCTVSAAGVIHLTGTGTCAVRASQTGNGTWNPAPDVVQSFAIT